MTKRNENEQLRGEQSFNYFFPTRWVWYIIYAISAGITSGLTIAITMIVTLLVLIGGLWLAYTYLPTIVFNIITLVVLADILLGVAVRLVLSGHNHQNEIQ